MKICIVHERFNVAGGVARVATELANLFDKNGHEVSLIDFSGKNEFYYTIEKDIECPSVIKERYFRIKLLKSLFFLKHIATRNPINVLNLYKVQIEELIGFLKENKHDILILCQGLLTSIIPRIKQDLPNIKIVAWQHNEYDTYIKIYYKKFLNYYLRGLELADLIVCLTKDDQQKFKKFNRNVCFIYNPLTIKNVYNKKSKLDEKNIIYVGRLLMKQKGLDYLIEIGNKLKNDWKILVAGDGPDKKKFIKLIKKNKLENKIILKGVLKNEELENFYLSGSIFISTSRWEGFGLVITEAMNFGLPIVSFENTGPKEILKNGDYGILVKKNDINEFIKKLNVLMNDPQKRFYYQQKSLERVKDFDIKIIGKEWENTLISLFN